MNETHLFHQLFIILNDNKIDPSVIKSEMGKNFEFSKLMDHTKRTDCFDSNNKSAKYMQRIYDLIEKHKGDIRDIFAYPVIHAMMPVENIESFENALVKEKLVKKIQKGLPFQQIDLDEKWYSYYKIHYEGLPEQVPPETSENAKFQEIQVVLKEEYVMIEDIRDRMQEEQQERQAFSNGGSLAYIPKGTQKEQDISNCLGIISKYDDVTIDELTTFPVIRSMLVLILLYFHDQSGLSNWSPFGCIGNPVTGFSYGSMIQVRPSHNALAKEDAP